MARLKERYRDEVVPALQSEFQYQNPMQVPQLQKIVINIGMGEALQNAKALDAAISDLTQITGQKPVTTKARMSIATFKLREGNTIGVAVTLRGERMWSFLDKLCNIALPRRARLYRRVGGCLRWPGQLQLGAARAAHLPGD